MMHGYLALDDRGGSWSPSAPGATPPPPGRPGLTERFSFNIPQRWSIAHLYQAILNGEEHVKDIAYLTTLAGYVHYKLTGRRCWAWARPAACSPSTATPGL